MPEAISGRRIVSLVALTGVVLLMTACAAARPLAATGVTGTSPGVGASVSAAGPSPAGSAGSERVAAQVAGAEQSGIDVNGQGKVLVSPDVARVMLGVEVRNPSLAAAQTEAATRVDAILNQLKQAGIDEKDIRTVQFTVQPITRFDERERRQVSDGFLVVHLLQVTFRDISSLGARIDQVIQAGATNVQSIQFDVADPAAAAAQAREQAVADARAKAEQLARLTGVTLGRPLFITEGTGIVPPPQPLRAAPAAEAVGAQPPTQIEPGQTEIQVNVHIRYAIQ